MATYTVQCLYPLYFAAVVTLEADTPEEACELAIAQANDADAWNPLDQPGPIFVERLALGIYDCPWNAPAAGAVPIPIAFSELATLGGIPGSAAPSVSPASD